jgi:DNA-binding MarR family transcriptional regulator
MQRRPLRTSKLESHLSYWLHYVGYRVFHELGLRTQKFGVTGAESVVLRKLHEQPSMPSHLALRLGLTRSAISKLAKRLEAKELIHRTKSLPDRRATLLTLTQLGRVLVPVLAATADLTDARNFRRAGQAYREVIEHAMKWIVWRDRLRFLPQAKCRITPEYIYADGEGYS